MTSAELIARRKRNLEKHGGLLEVSRIGLCSQCGQLISDTTIAHGLLGGTMCKGKPTRGWRYRRTVSDIVVHPASEYPHLSAIFDEMDKEARRTKSSVRRTLESSS